MRRRTGWILIAVGAVAVLLVALVVPVMAAPRDNPFVGSWETVYVDDVFPDRDIRFQVGGNGHLHLRSSGSSVCESQGFGFVPTSGFGSGSITSDDPFVFEATVDLYCHTRNGNGRPLAFTDFYVAYEYDPATDTLVALHYPAQAEFNCIWRSGSDSSACP